MQTRTSTSSMSLKKRCGRPPRGDGYLDGFQTGLDRHHGPDYGTESDPDFAFLLLLGIRPGTPRRELWRCLFRTLASPRFHWLFLKSRLRSNFVSAPAYRVAMSGCFFSTIALAVI